MFQGPFVCERVTEGIEDYDYFSIRDARGKLVASCGTSEDPVLFIVDLMNRGSEIQVDPRKFRYGYELVQPSSDPRGFHFRIFNRNDDVVDICHSDELAKEVVHLLNQGMYDQAKDKLLLDSLSI